MPVKLLTSGGGGVNLVPSSSIASDQTMYLPTSGTSGGTVLCTDSTGGTANGVLYLNGSKQVTSGSGLVFSSSGNLGIGTVSPSAKLHLNNGNVRLDSDSGTTTITVIKNDVGLGSLTTFGDTVATDFYTATVFKSSGVEKMRLDSSGNLGIGTSSPSYPLQVRRAGGAGSLGISVNNVVGYSRDVLYYAIPDTSTDTSGHVFYVRNGSATDNMAMRIDSSGNLLVGVTAHQGAKLQVGTALTDGLGTIPNCTVGARSAVTSYSASPALSLSYYSSAYGADFWVSTDDPTFWPLFIDQRSPGPIIFRRNTRSGTGTESMRIDASGNLLVGTTSAGLAGLDMKTVVSGGVNGIGVSCQASGTPQAMRFAYGTTAVGSIVIGPSSTSYNTSSDYRLKEDVQPVADAITRLNQLKPVNFAWKVDGSRCDGFLAHELQEVIPEASTGTKDETRIEEYEVTPAIKDEEGNVITEAVMGEREVPIYQGIDQSKIVPLLTAALQEAVAKIESLTQRIEALEYTKQGE